MQSKGEWSDAEIRIDLGGVIEEEEEAQEESGKGGSIGENVFTTVSDYGCIRDIEL